MVDLDGNTFDIPPWTGTSEGAATVITAMIDPTITSELFSWNPSNTQLTFNSDSSGSYLNQNAVSDHELHTHLTNTTNWTKLWDLSENMTSETFSV